MVSFADKRLFGPPQDGDMLVWSSTDKQWILTQALLPAQSGGFTARPWINVTGGIGFRNSWTDAGGFTSAYRLTPDGAHVEMAFTITGGTAGGICTLPAAFAPAVGKSFSANDDFAGTTGFYADIATNGSVAIFGTGGINTHQFSFNVQIPLDR